MYFLRREKGAEGCTEGSSKTYRNLVYTVLVVSVQNLMGNSSREFDLSGAKFERRSSDVHEANSSVVYDDFVCPLSGQTRTDAGAS